MIRTKKQILDKLGPIRPGILVELLLHQGSRYVHRDDAHLKREIVGYDAPKKPHEKGGEIVVPGYILERVTLGKDRLYLSSEWTLSGRAPEARSIFYVDLEAICDLVKPKSGI